jgi:hypothetical protein
MLISNLPQYRVPRDERYASTLVFDAVRREFRDDRQRRTTPGWDEAYRGTIASNDRESELFSRTYFCNACLKVAIEIFALAASCSCVMPLRARPAAI